MPSFGRTSQQHLNRLHPHLRSVLRRAIQVFDFSIVSSKRTEEEQADLVGEGRSTTLRSKHVYPIGHPAWAADLRPFPFDGYPTPQDPDQRRAARWGMMIGIMIGIAADRGIPLRVGMDWDGDGTLNDQNFHDWPHIELDIPIPDREGV